MKSWPIILNNTIYNTKLFSMDRITFLKMSSILFAVPFFPSVKSWATQDKLKNWAGNFTFSTSNVHYPQSVSEVQNIVKSSNKLRALGTRHCFNRIADSNYKLLSSKNLNKVIELNTEAKTVTVEGGIKYGELSPYLHQKGFALHNLASLPHISVAGSFTTATHGSGVENGNLATQVAALEIVTANGEVVSLSRKKDGDQFLGAVVSLGAMGVITKATLNIQPTYEVKQYVYEWLPMEQLKEHFEKIVSAGYSVSLFTDWQKNSINEVWIKTKEEDNFKAEKMFYGATAATTNLHPIAEISAENCTEQLGVPGPWHERLPHFKMGFTPSSGKELQTEYFVPFNHAVEAIQAIARLGKQIGPHLFISEIRTIAADDFWMSPCRGQKSVALHFTWKQEWEAVSKLLPIIEKELYAFNARPHWGKLFTMSPKVLASRYDKLDDFTKLITTYDPKGKFRNDFLNATILANT